jgi:hypothetical protein
MAAQKTRSPPLSVAQVCRHEPKLFVLNDLPIAIYFIDENGGGPGVRLRKRQRPNQTK